MRPASSSPSATPSARRLRRYWSGSSSLASSAAPTSTTPLPPRNGVRGSTPPATRPGASGGAEYARTPRSASSASRTMARSLYILRCLRSRGACAAATSTSTPSSRSRQNNASAKTRPLFVRNAVARPGASPPSHACTSELQSPCKSFAASAPRTERTLRAANILARAWESAGATDAARVWARAAELQRHQPPAKRPRSDARQPQGCENRSQRRVL
mmetsp:Transcript_6079/g.19178  ORF Transcript_6079/g.19178 Transcript_6079/m.19178 type:complete len:216 (+) Transcript_6079:461-1108(+)